MSGAGGEEGFTLAELSVVGLLIGVVSAFMSTAFLNVQQTATTSLVRQQQAQSGALAMATIARDLRAIADDQVLNRPLIQAMGTSSLTAEVDVDTTSSANATAGALSAFTGCPDLVTIAQTPANGVSGAGPITETRTHPSNAANTACAWPTAGTQAYTTNTHVQTLAPLATLTFAYLTYVTNAATSTSPPATATSAATTATIQVSLSVSPVGGSSGLPGVALVQSVPLASFSSYLGAGN